MPHPRIGLVGAGSIARVHALSWRSLGADVTIWSRSGAADLAEATGAVVAASFEELLDRVDVLDVCTPTPSHAELALRGVRAGRGVICEKPVARTAAEALALASAAAEAGVRVLPAHVVRYFPAYRELRDAVAAGRIGAPVELRLERRGPAPTADWFFDEELSGGPVLDLMIHDVDQARWIAGEVIEVSAIQDPPSTDGAVPRMVVVRAVLAHRSGAISRLEAEWGQVDAPFATSVEVAGEHGRLGHDSATDPDPLRGRNPYADQLGELLAAVEQGAEPRVSIADGILALGVAEAALASIRTGAPVRVDEAGLLAAAGSGS